MKKIILLIVLCPFFLNVQAQNLKGMLKKHADKAEKDTKEEPLQDKGNLKEVEPLLRKAWKQFQDDDGWVNIGAAGSFLKRAQPDFDPRSYGVTKTTQVVQLLNKVFEMKRQNGKGTTQVVLYRPKKK